MYEHHIDFLNHRLNDKMSIATKLKNNDGTCMSRMRSEHLDNELLFSTHKGNSGHNLMRLGASASSYSKFPGATMSIGSAGRGSENTETPSPSKKPRKGLSNTKSKFKSNEEQWVFEK